MTHTVEQIASAIGAQAEGNLGLLLAGAAEPAQARAHQLAMAMSPEFAEQIGQGAAQVAVMAEGADWRAYGLEAAILVPRPRFAMARVTQAFDPGPEMAPGIHPSAVVDPSADIAEGASIGPLAVIGRDVRIGPRARIASHVTIGAGAVIGADALLFEKVHIGHHCVIGDRFIAQPGAVVGGDGFSFVTPEAGAVEAVRSSLGDRGGLRQQAYARIHSLGAVRIGDDVELGANTCVDRGTVADTVIGRGTKLDCLILVGHNVQIGEDCLLCGQCGVAGSSRLGNRVVIGGMAGVADHVTLGDDVIAGAAAIIRSNQPAGRVLLGDPAIEMSASIQGYKNMRRLPRLFAQVAELRKTLSKPDSND
ncbi:UDP-3-O-(3-hydroxymyristoyl)glucosamine N-acyltransferase [Alphaproteobacteria bacterium KMM 3653]|uniref:UDP-3-O-acylglucosamine N-acyltransferase n=1 Tax=Harenicola maris TaxID=2841044 RepID=A0AAP2G343_9RHOB|nr:UDP-3-O-(3-hydroxymyristoyl)glucosamine N-acyltransferase [Harenicola maris]